MKGQRTDQINMPAISRFHYIEVLFHITISWARNIVQNNVIPGSLLYQAGADPHLFPPFLWKLVKFYLMNIIFLIIKILSKLKSCFISGLDEMIRRFARRKELANNLS